MSHPASLTAVSAMTTLHASEYAAAAFLARYGPATRDAYSGDLKAFFYWCRTVGLDPLAADRVHLELYSRHLTEERGLKASSANRRLGTVCLFFKIATADGRVDRDPSLLVRRPRIPRVSATRGMSFLEYAAFLRAAEDSDDVSEWCLGALLGLLGLRASEAVGITIADLGEEQGHRVVHVLGKGSKPARLPLPVPVARAVDAATDSRREGPLLRNKWGNPMTRRNAYDATVRIGARAGLPYNVHPHQLRHCLVTQLLDAGVSPRDVMRATRHSDIRMVEYYDRARPNHDRNPVYVLAARMSGSG